MSSFKCVFNSERTHGSSCDWGTEWPFFLLYASLGCYKCCGMMEVLPIFNFIFYFEIGLHDIVNGGMLSPGMNAWGLQ